MRDILVKIDSKSSIVCDKYFLDYLRCLTSIEYLKTHKFDKTFTEILRNVENTYFESLIAFIEIADFNGALNFIDNLGNNGTNWYVFFRYSFYLPSSIFYVSVQWF